MQTVERVALSAQRADTQAAGKCHHASQVVRGRTLSSRGRGINVRHLDGGLGPKGRVLLHQRDQLDEVERFREYCPDAKLLQPPGNFLKAVRG